MKTFVRISPLVLLLAVSLTLVTPATASYHSPMHVGVRCQNDFQNNWAPTIDMYSMCSNFNNQIRGTDYLDFYFNLHGAESTFGYGNYGETCNACGGPDSVDFFFLATHGTIANNDPTYAGYAMWDNKSTAWTHWMRFGSSGKQLKILATYSCDTLKTSDGLFWNRWSSVFRGGLKVAVGAHDLVYDGNSQKGTEFASRIQNGEPIGQAWDEAVWYADNSNHPSVANTGVNANDCWSRMGMNLALAEWHYPLRDGQIGYVCWAGWNGS